MEKEEGKEYNGMLEVGKRTKNKEEGKEMETKRITY